MAAPHVSAAAALVMAADPGLSGPQVATLLRETASPLTQGGDLIDGGLLNAGAAVKAAASRDLPEALDGYQLVGSDGGVYSSGVAASRGSTAGDHVTHPIVGGAERTDGLGYWLVTSNGTIFAFGDATSYGSATKMQLAHPIVGMTATPDGKGYWILANDGGIFAFGDAKYYGSMADMSLADPIVGMASTPDGKGYWLVANNGAVFAFGDAHFYGPTSKIRFTHPIVGMAATPDGKGYWLAGNDGGVFAFGDATFFGSEAGRSLAHPIVGIAPARTGPVTGSPVLPGKCSLLGPPLTRSRPAQKSRLRRSLLFFLRHRPLCQTSRLLSRGLSRSRGRFLIGLGPIQICPCWGRPDYDWRDWAGDGALTCQESHCCANCTGRASVAI